MTSMTGGCLCGRVGYIIVGSADRDLFSLDRAAIWLTSRNGTRSASPRNYPCWTSRKSSIMRAKPF